MHPDSMAKSMKNPATIHQNYVKNLSQIFQNRGPEAPKSRSGGILDGSGAHIGFLERADAVWEPVRGKIVANIAPTWVLRSCKNQKKIDAKIDQKSDACQGRFFNRF